MTNKDGVSIEESHQIILDFLDVLVLARHCNTDMITIIILKRKRLESVGVELHLYLYAPYCPFWVFALSKKFLSWPGQASDKKRNFATYFISTKETD